MDTSTISDSMPLIGMWFESLLEIMFSLYFLYEILGYAVFAGCGLMVLLVPVNAYLSSKSFKVIEDHMKLNDDRIKLLSEVINGIKVRNADGSFNNTKSLVKTYLISARVCSTRNLLGIIEHLLIYYRSILWFYSKPKAIVWRTSLNGNRLKTCNPQVPDSSPAIVTWCCVLSQVKALYIHCLSISSWNSVSNYAGSWPRID